MNLPIVSAVAAGVVSLASFFTTTTTPPLALNVARDHPSTVIATDVQFNQFFPEIKGDLALQQSNHTRRLQIVESALRRHDASWMTPKLQAERARNLDRLRDYWQRGEYPLNYEHPGAWDPVFIDRDGNICAVGYLVEQSLGRAAAEQINSRYHFATIRQIDAPELGEWVKNSGLTYEEVVAIQAPAVDAQDRSQRLRSPRNPVIAKPQPTQQARPEIRIHRSKLSNEQLRIDAPLLELMPQATPQVAPQAPPQTVPQQTEAIATEQPDTEATAVRPPAPVEAPGIQ